MRGQKELSGLDIDDWVEFNIPSWELTYPLPSHSKEDDFPFPKAGYVSSLDFTSGWFCQNYTQRPSALSLVVDWNSWISKIPRRVELASPPSYVWELGGCGCTDASEMRLLRQSSELFNCWNEWFNVVLVNRQGVIRNLSPSIPKRFKRKLGNVSQLLWWW